MKKTIRPDWDKKTCFPSLMTYADERQIKFVLAEKSDQFDFAEYILHDKDNNEPHYHVVFHLKKPRYVSDIIAWFGRCVDDNGKLVNTMGQPTRSTEDVDDYLTHKNDSSKHQYTEEDIRVPYGSRDAYRELKTEYQICEEAEAAKAFARERAADDVEQMLEDIINGVSYRDMARRYGRDFIRNVSSYRDYASNIVFEETNDIKKALNIEKSPLALALEEHDSRLISVGYTAGTKDVLAVLGSYINAEIDRGASYLNDVAELIRNIQLS